MITAPFWLVLYFWGTTVLSLVGMVLCCDRNAQAGRGRVVVGTRCSVVCFFYVLCYYIGEKKSSPKKKPKRDNVCCAFLVNIFFLLVFALVLLMAFHLLKF